MVAANVLDRIKVDVAVRILLYFSLGLFTAGFFQKGRLPEKKDIDSRLYQEPLQKAVQLPPFEVEASGFKYQVQPLYSYELGGLVVSQHDTLAWWDYYHKKWQDALNLKDLCVIWGDNLKDQTYRRMRFRNGSWTCYVSVNAATAEEDWAKFNMAALSNNHLLSSDPMINKILRKVEVGDQIYLKGYLAAYKRQGSSLGRDTSTSRNDEDCETIYLSDFKIIKRANRLWHFLYGFSKIMIFTSLAFLIFLGIRAPLGR